MDKELARSVRHSLGRRIRELRTARKLTQAKVAARIALSQKYVSEVERGRRSPSLEALEAIAHRGFGIKLASLVVGVDENIEREVQNFSHVFAGWPSDARREMMRGLELIVRAIETVCRARGAAQSIAAMDAGIGRPGVAANATRAKRRG